MGVTHEWYWRGHRHGQTVFDDEQLIDRERMLRAELNTATKPEHRAWVLGELRGYRERTRVVDGSYIEQWKAERVRQLRQEQAEAMRASDAGAWEER